MQSWFILENSQTYMKRKVEKVSFQSCKHRKKLTPVHHYSVSHKTKGVNQEGETNGDLIQERDEGSLLYESEKKSPPGSSAPGQHSQSRLEQKTRGPRMYASRRQTNLTLKDKCDPVENHTERHFIYLFYQIY